MQFNSQKRRRAPSVIIVSLIDVLLVVLIFLMVTTAFKKEQPALKLALPESKIAKPGSTNQTPPFVITVVTNAPFFFLGTTPVGIDRVDSELQARVKQDPNLRVVIRADRGAAWGNVLRLIDSAKLAQVSSIDAFTEKAAGR